MSLNHFTSFDRSRESNLNICAETLCTEVAEFTNQTTESLTATEHLYITTSDEKTVDLHLASQGNPADVLHSDGAGAVYWAPPTAGSGNIVYSGTPTIPIGSHLKASSTNADTVVESKMVEDVTNLNLNSLNVTSAGTYNGVDVSTLDANVTSNTSAISTLQSDRLKVDGSTPMTGSLDMGNNSIVNVNLVDGVDVFNLKTQADNNSTQIGINTTNISNNSGNIVTNTNAINQNISDIAANTAAVAGKLDKAGDSMTGNLIMGNNNISGIWEAYLSKFINFTHTTTPATPGAGTNSLYFKSDSNLYTKGADGNERQIAAAPVGSYIEYDDPSATTVGQHLVFDNTVGSLVKGSSITEDNFKVDLSNKEVVIGDRLTAAHITTPANPPVNKNSLYFKSDDKLYSLTSGGVETEIGSSPGGVSFTGTPPTVVGQHAIYNSTDGTEIAKSSLSETVSDLNLNGLNLTGVGNITKSGYTDTSEISEPTAPLPGKLRLFTKTGSDNLFTKTSAGVVQPLRHTEQLSTGVLNGGLLTEYLPDLTKFNVSDGEGEIVDSNGIETQVTWDTFSTTPQSIPDPVGLQPGDTPVASGIGLIANRIITFVSVSSTGSLVLSAQRPSASKKRDYIFLGVLVHTHAGGPLDNTINVTNDQQMTIRWVGNQINDMADAIGFINVSGNDILKSPGGLLKIQKQEGVMFAFGSNFKNEPKNPHNITLPAIDTASGTGFFQYRMKDGSSSALTLTDIIPNLKDNGFPYDEPQNNEFTNPDTWGVMRVFSFTSNALKIQPAQFGYSTQDAAIAGIESEGFVVEPSIAANGLLIGYIVLDANATTLASGTFIKAGKFGSGGGGVSSVDISGKLNTDGSNEMLGDLNMGDETHKIINLADPTLPQDGATKAYADTKVASLTSAGVAVGNESLVASASGSLKGLVAGTNITLSSDGTDVTINSTGGGGGGITVEKFSFPSGLDNKPFFNDGNITLGWDAPGNDIELFLLTPPLGNGFLSAVAWIAGVTGTQLSSITTINQLYDLYDTGVSSQAVCNIIISADNDPSYPSYEVSFHNASDSFNSTCVVKKFN